MEHLEEAFGWGMASHGHWGEERRMAGPLVVVTDSVFPDLEPVRSVLQEIGAWVELAEEDVVLTPHLAFYSEESLVELQTKAAREVARVLRGEPPLNPVNPEVLEGA